MQQLRQWFVGKKMYIAGGLLIAVAIAGVATGRMGLLTAGAIGGYGLSLWGFSAKTDRKHRELIAILEAAGVLGMAARGGGIAAAVAAGQRELPVLVNECTKGDDAQ